MLEDLVALRVDVRTSIDSLSEYPLDSDVEHVVVSAAHLRHAIGAYRAGSISGEELSAWAELLSGRDDVGYAEAERDLIADGLFELATPELFGPLDEVARDLEARLS